MEDKQSILDCLLKTYQQTRAGIDIDSMTIDSDEYVTVAFSNGTEQRINCACDSGAAMILDVVRNIRIM